jgi:hypothetical protein
VFPGVRLVQAGPFAFNPRIAILTDLDPQPCMLSWFQRSTQVRRATVLRFILSAVTRGVVLGIAIAAAVAAAIPIVAYPFRPGGRLDPYRNRSARWLVYLGAGLALALFIVLARSGQLGWHPRTQAQTNVFSFGYETSSAGMTRVQRFALLGLAYLGLLAYIWFDALSNGWGWGWALFGTLNVTAAGLLLLGIAWLVARIVRRTRR